jgi:uncharacterized protein YifE (UPF0438 family)
LIDIDPFGAGRDPPQGGTDLSEQDESPHEREWRGQRQWGEAWLRERGVTRNGLESLTQTQILGVFGYVRDVMERYERAWNEARSSHKVAVKDLDRAERAAERAEEKAAGAKPNTAEANASKARAARDAVAHARATMKEAERRVEATWASFSAYHFDHKPPAEILTESAGQAENEAVEEAQNGKQFKTFHVETVDMPHEEYVARFGEPRPTTLILRDPETGE